MNVPKRPYRRLSEFEEARIRRLCAGGLTYRQCAVLTHRSHVVCRRVALGIEKRPKTKDTLKAGKPQGVSRGDARDIRTPR